VPIPGIKTAGALIPLACGLHLPDGKRRADFRVASNLPAYDVIGTWTTSFLAAERIVWPLLPSSGMRLEVKELERALNEKGEERVDLVYVIRPGNPAAVGATASEWKELIEHCLERGTRLVNDAAYVGLAGEQHVALARVACEYPDLEWIEMVSVSKSFSDPGARLGALVGSRDFVEDFRLVKGNTESGPVPYVMRAYADFLRNGDSARRALDERRELYDRRLAYVVEKLNLAGLRPACPTDAGFFTLWEVPRRVLGVSLADDPRTRDLPPHEAFNRLVISETGIVGVHFQGPTGKGGATPLIRYGVCTDVLAPEFQERFERGLQRLQPEY
jgi:aspartate/methionine/tyrosine aminotransferase